MKEKKPEPTGSERIIISYPDLRKAYMNNKKIQDSMSFEEFCEWTRKMQVKIDEINLVIAKKYVTKT